MKKFKGYIPIGVIIHIYMEISQGNSLGTYLYLKQAKNVFHFIFSLFSSTKSENKSTQSESWHLWQGEVLGKRDRRINMVQKMCTHVCKCKNDTC
jgi:hypothetical protein